MIETGNCKSTPSHHDVDDVLDDYSILTCAEDGKVCILKTGTWNVEKTLLKHTQGI